jgi:hypothetical protein
MELLITYIQCHLLVGVTLRHDINTNGYVFDANQALHPKITLFWYVSLILELVTRQRATADRLWWSATYI